MTPTLTRSYRSTPAPMLANRTSGVLFNAAVIPRANATRAPVDRIAKDLYGKDRAADLDLILRAARVRAASC